MIGTIIGDIAGSTYEHRNSRGMNFPLLTPKSTFTDDTICTIAVADAIMNDWSIKDSLLHWTAKYPNPMGGYGLSFLQWIHSRDHLPYYSYGNGAAMRVASIGWLFDSPQEVLEAAKDSAEVTHNHPEGIKGAGLTALAVFYLRNGWTKDDVKDIICCGYDLPKTTRPNTNPYSESCMNAVPVAFACFYESNSFTDAIRRAIAVGGDSDTIAAICGSFAEAYYGIPADVYERYIKLLPDDLAEVVNQFEITIGRRYE